MRLLLSIIVATFFASANVTVAQEATEGIQFTHASWKQVLSKAKKENKLIFVDCFTTWCGPCKTLSKDIFPQKAVGDYFNSAFVNVKIDMEKGEGIELKTQFGITAFPTMLFIDPANEEILHRLVGTRDAETLIAEAKGAPAEAKRAKQLAADYKKNKKDIKVVEDYLSYLVKVSDPSAKEVALHYINMIPKNTWKNEENFWIVSRYVKDPFGKEATYFFENRDAFYESVGVKAEYFESGLFYGYASDLASVETKKDFNEKKFGKLLELMADNKFDRIESIKDYTTRTLLVSTKDWDGYISLIEKKFAKGLAKGPNYYSNEGFNLLNRLRDCDIPAVHARAADLMDEAIAVQFANPKLDMFGLSIAYRDQLDHLQKAGIAGERLAVTKAMTELFDNISPKHRALLDKTYKDAQKAKAEGKTGGRSVPAMRMGGF